MCETYDDRTGRKAKWEDILQQYQEGWLRLADAALDALREPTQAMMSEVLDATAGDPVSVCDGVMNAKDMFLVAHQAMIRAAREDK